MELLAVKLEKKQNGSTEVYAEKKILGRVAVAHATSATVSCQLADTCLQHRSWQLDYHTRMQV